MMSCVVALVAGTAFSEEIKFDRLTSADGLSQASANAILEDSQGLLWIGTQDG